MDYESLLYELQPILQAPSVDQIPLEPGAPTRYLRALDRAAVCLRSEHNRAVAGASGLLQRLLAVLDQALHKCLCETRVDSFWWSFASDLVRCVANCLVDSDANRHTLARSGAALMHTYVGQICALQAPQHAELQMRAVALAKNMCLGADGAYSRTFAPCIRAPLVQLLRRRAAAGDGGGSSDIDDTLCAVGSGLLLEFAEADARGSRSSLEELGCLAHAVLHASRRVRDLGPDEDELQQQQPGDEHDLEDPALETVANLSQCFELAAAAQDPAADFAADFADHPEVVHAMQRDLLQALDVLLPKRFADKLIHMRRLMSCVGHVSAQRANSNTRERPLCYDTVCHSHNAYKIGAALLVLSNSVNSASDAAEVLHSVSFDQLIGAGSHLKDPVQMQGFLDLLRKLLSVSSAMQLTPHSVRQLAAVLEPCHAQSTFYKDISPLLDGLLKKLLTVLPSSVLYDSLTPADAAADAAADAPPRPLLAIISGRDSVLACLALDKLLVSRRAPPSQDILQPLWHAACKFQDHVASGEGQISVFYLFQLAKTFGIYLKNLHTDGQPMGEFYKAPLIRLLELIGPLRGKNDQASQSAVNNGKFVATMVIKLLDEETAPVESTQDAQQDELLLQLARKFF